MSFQFESLAETGGYIHGHNDQDKDGNPTGGYASDSVDNIVIPLRWHKDMEHPTTVLTPGFFIRWQDGPLNRELKKEPNGAFVEDILMVCAKRLEFYQQSKFACEANAQALDKIQKAVMDLVNRRDDRKERGVLGKNLR